MFRHRNRQTVFARIPIQLVLHLNFALCICSFASAQNPASNVATDEIDNLIAQLDKVNPDEVRLAAMKSLLQKKEDVRATNAVPAIKLALKDDNSEIRFQSLLTMTFILAAHDRECPTELLEMTDDPSERVQSNYSHLLDNYKHYPPEAFEVALTLYEKADKESKSNFLPLIGKTGKKDRRALKILIDAVNSDFANRRVKFKDSSQQVFAGDTI